MTDRNQTGVVLADVGGTNVRFAVLRDGVLGPIAHMTDADHREFGDALATFMAGRADRASIRHALFGVAGVVENERCSLTNSPWIVDADALRARFGFGDIHIVNDFEALAWSLPRFTSDDLRRIAGGEPKPFAPMVVLGPGTGLGVAAYVPGRQGAFVLHSEGGHASVPGGSLREDAIIARLRRQFGHVSAERVLSGHGLENLYRTIAALESLTLPNRSAPEITQAAIAGSCATSRAAVETFCALLGAVAGDLALAFGAQGGVFITGGIADHLRDHLPHSPFRARFDAKGRMTSYLEAIPVYLILHDDPAFLGLQSLAAERAWPS